MSGTLLSSRGLSLARPQAALVTALLALAIVAWWLTARRMDGMAGGGSLALGAFGFYVGLWVVMMAAMMFPSIAPMVVVYDRLRSAHRARDSGAPGVEGTALFVAGYLVVWLGAGVAAYALVVVGRAADLGVLAWDRAGSEVVAGVVLLAAAYQATPLKHACLRRCRGPLSFVLEHWRGGTAGALRMGVAHGAWCVGCCWALMAALFALGLMSLGWMAFVAALIAAEKLVRRNPWPAVAAVLLVLGLAILVAPDAVPGLGPDPAPAMDM